jgi:hypothetical protein
VTTITKSPALVHSKFVNGNTTFGAEATQPSMTTDKIYSSKASMARTDDNFHDNFQGFEADNNSKVRPEAMPNHQPFANPLVLLKHLHILDLCIQ